MRPSISCNLVLRRSASCEDVLRARAREAAKPATRTGARNPQPCSRLAVFVRLVEQRCARVFEPLVLLPELQAQKCRQDSPQPHTTPSHGSRTPVPPRQHRGRAERGFRADARPGGRRVSTRDDGDRARDRARVDRDRGRGADARGRRRGAARAQGERAVSSRRRRVPGAGRGGRPRRPAERKRQTGWCWPSFEVLREDDASIPTLQKSSKTGLRRSELPRRRRDPPREDRGPAPSSELFLSTADLRPRRSTTRRATRAASTRASTSTRTSRRSGIC